MTTLAVVITSYNYGRFLDDAIDSVLGQTRPADHVVVVDDGSTDGSRAVLTRRADEVEALLLDHGGVSTATNAGVSATTADVVLLLDADDLMAPTRLEEVAAVYESDPTVQWVFHRMDHVDRDSRAPLGTESGGTRWQPGRCDVTAAARRGSMSVPALAPATSGLTFRGPFLRSLLPVPATVGSQDNYLKFASFALAPGHCLDSVLSHQGIHTSNMYTGRTPAEQVRFRAENAVATAAGFEALGPATRASGDSLVAAALVLSRGGTRLDRPVRDALAAHLRHLPWSRRRRIATRTATALLRTLVETARQAVASRRT